MKIKIKPGRYVIHILGSGEQRGEDGATFGFRAQIIRGVYQGQIVDLSLAFKYADDPEAPSFGNQILKNLARCSGIVLPEKLEDLDAATFKRAKLVAEYKDGLFLPVDPAP
jgi:hypothetical protein